MTFWEYVGTRCQQLLVDAYQHAGAVFPCRVVATVLGGLTGLLTYRTEWAGNLAITMTASILTVPSLTLLGLPVPVVGLGVAPAVIALTLYGLLPVVRNAVVGLRGVDPAPVEAAKGRGMSPLLMLFRAELPLVVPLILAGVWTALVLNVGTATPAAFGVGGGLGDPGSSGITNQRMPVLVLGFVLTVAMALIMDWLRTLVGLLLRPRGLEVD
ncbi:MULTISPECIES: ABC transporter permease [Streptomyces]|uniref:ABC transporter permease n=1 Tax=Streptomyces TaxID=1883 RepID=UPI00341E05EC